MPSAAINHDGQTRAMYQDVPFDERQTAQITNQINNPGLMDQASSEAYNMLFNPPSSMMDFSAAASGGSTPSNQPQTPGLRDTMLLSGQNNPPSNP
jgi:hypothetical protein